jgi:hypothetical protein
MTTAGRATWTPIAPLRAQIVQVNTEELLRNYGPASESVAIFQTRSIDGVTPADHLLEAVASFDIKEVTEIGRRRGLEIREVAKEIGS